MKKHPNECLGTLAEWEEAVFRNASHFTVFRRIGRFNRDTKLFQTFPEAIQNAQDDPTALVYAVTIEGRSLCVVRSQWNHYAQIWAGKI